MKTVANSNWIKSKSISPKQISIIIKQIAYRLLIIAALFCLITPLRGICNCENCPYSNLSDSQSLYSISKSSENYINSTCCSQYQNNNFNNFDNNSNNSNNANNNHNNTPCGFCICICSDSNQSLIADSNQLLKSQSKTQLDNIFETSFIKSIQHVNTDPTCSNVNDRISKYREFYNSPLSRLSDRIHSILNVWQI
jgi:hypothetical protein